jgi:hypothetical protein
LKGSGADRESAEAGEVYPIGCDSGKLNAISAKEGGRAGMATIIETAEKVARELAEDRQFTEEEADLRAYVLDVAEEAALRMSDKLEKSIGGDELISKLLEFNTRTFKQAELHNQVFIIAGYAAFFALWSAVAADIPRPARLYSGGIMVLSLIVFVGWTVTGMIVAKVMMDRTLAVFLAGPVDFYERHAKMERVNLKTRDKLMRWWLPTVTAAAGTALIATIVLSVSAGIEFITSADEIEVQCPDA